MNEKSKSLIAVVVLSLGVSLYVRPAFQVFATSWQSGYPQNLIISVSAILIAILFWKNRWLWKRLIRANGVIDKTALIIGLGIEFLMLIMAVAHAWISGVEDLITVYWFIFSVNWWFFTIAEHLRLDCARFFL